MIYTMINVLTLSQFQHVAFDMVLADFGIVFARFLEFCSGLVLENFFFLNFFAIFFRNFFFRDFFLNFFKIFRDFFPIKVYILSNNIITTVEI